MTASGDGPHLLIIAGVHGDEYEPIQAVRKLTGHLQADSILQRGTLSLVAVVNEPAHQLDARCGPDNKDLARTCPGNPGGSITEKIASEISDFIGEADYLIDMHTGGKMYEIYPLSGYVLHTDQTILEKQRRMCQVFGLPVQWGTSPFLEGRTLSVARDAGVPAIYTEYGGGGPSRPEIVHALFRGCLNVLSDLNMISVANNDPTPVKYIIEDHRPDSGHLQILYPAPMAGELSHLVNMGERVTRHQPLARIACNEKNESVLIRAEEDGIVFLMNRQKEIGKGISTTGVLPISKPGKIQLP